MYQLIVFDLVVLSALNLPFFNWYVGILFSLCMTLSFFAFRLYDLENVQNYNEQIIRTTVGTLFSFILILFFYPLFEKDITRYNFFYNFLVSVVLIPPLNTLLGKLLIKNQPTKTFLVVGRKEEIEPILKEIEEKTTGKYRFAEYINPTVEVLKRKLVHYDGVLLADPEFEDVLKKVNIERVEYLPNLVEKTLKRIPMKVLEKFREYYEVCFSAVNDDSPAKRILDIAVSLIALAVFSPIMLVVGIIIYLEDGRPVVFRQKRVGKDGKTFTMLKLRSMRKKQEKTPKFADQEKDRILKIGRIIRPFRIDEALQFVNVLKGEMSVVGPRPEQEEFVKIFEKQIPFYSLRHRVKPGITGWAQLMYKYSSNLEEVKKKLSYDLWYVKNRNIFLDLRIILQTLEAVLWRRGAK
ncbi:polyprenyl glycosylphosphotransferase [Thermotoga maritima MSB8]|uniref:Extracellular polysaccharide biosynthesis-related protein n=1 Tax=Thermotoga maritima (strain ATCC 43589 / DSM 3109 / JCM 10099 / NBRC 100826 / MSB8) TaxID=243274 RepID=Q9WZA0_THEMA|nr:sugar transferase [Thermotoga maritima]AAD35716.1 extracellular polysaccharide biosynthesis-related protein [Thermotoga maritima MSB8]AGL49558.1 Bacterial sugar transferase [Thermotoga maritima MSB8]AHD17613.1 polyprenyl glycosylphosphotransferase [Thermotoga maritima MSB8]AKE26555.1 polyprenyl glycosylphosphotransferase [Thermotoga maritima]AKE28420.1 polyprenyl glycosylphosphotransferase [Thermotoga maritima MSB8]